jgi:hypothetical protein
MTYRSMYVLKHSVYMMERDLQRLIAYAICYCLSELHIQITSAELLIASGFYVVGWHQAHFVKRK